MDKILQEYTRRLNKNVVHSRYSGYEDINKDIARELRYFGTECVLEEYAEDGQMDGADLRLSFSLDVKDSSDYIICDVFVIHDARNDQFYVTEISDLELI